MSKIYIVVMDYGYDGKDNESVWSSKELAEKRVAELRAEEHYCDDFLVEVWNLDGEDEV